MNCIRLESPLPNDNAVAACLNSNLHFTSTFFGERSLEHVFYEVLATAHRECF